MNCAMREGEVYHYHEDVNWGLLRLWAGRTGLRLLDVGCGFATTSARIQKLGNDVTGIDSSPEIAAIARPRLGRVISADLEDFETVGREIGETRFDAIIFADVLEHLVWPLDTMREYLKWLKDGGSVLISLPNVGLWSVRFAHLFGRWEYDETGVLDRTHLRFYTRASARRLIAAAGLEVVKTTHNPGLARALVPLAKRVLARDSSDPAALMTSKPYRFYVAAIYPLERALTSLWPGMLAFQMLYETKRRG
jgi:2-polyprenyl-3-methyl-5-hydroxy-6-metoxy-1,4-benzoquinol methylase